MENLLERINPSFYFNKTAVGYEPDMRFSHPFNPQIELPIAYGSERFVEDLMNVLVQRLWYASDPFMVEISSHEKYFSRKKSEAFSPILITDFSPILLKEIKIYSKEKLTDDKILISRECMKETGIKNEAKILLRVSYHDELFVRWMKEFKEYSQLTGMQPTKTF